MPSYISMVHDWSKCQLQVKGALAGALYPNIAVMAEGHTMGRPGWNDGVAEVALHPASVLHPLEAPRFHRPFVVYLEKVRTAKRWTGCMVAQSH